MIAEDFLSRPGILLRVLRSCVSAHWAPDVQPSERRSKAGLHQTWQPSDWLGGGRGLVYTKHGFPVYWRASRNGR